MEGDASGPTIHLVRRRRHASVAAIARGLPQAVSSAYRPETLFQQTCRRLSGAPFGALTVLANHRHRFLVAEQLEEIGAPAKTIVLEPSGRNTAPAACVAALIAAEQDEEALVLLAPADHMIADDAAFARAVESGVGAAEAGALVVFGVAPDCPHTGYGYIETEPGTSR